MRVYINLYANGRGVHSNPYPSCKQQAVRNWPRFRRRARSRSRSHSRTPGRTTGRRIRFRASSTDLPFTTATQRHRPIDRLLAGTTGPTRSRFYRFTTTISQTSPIATFRCPTCQRRHLTRRPRRTPLAPRRARTSPNPSAMLVQQIHAPPRLPAHPSRKALALVPARRSTDAGCAKSRSTDPPPSARSASLCPLL